MKSVNLKRSCIKNPLKQDRTECKMRVCVCVCPRGYEWCKGLCWLLSIEQRGQQQCRINEGSLWWNSPSECHSFYTRDRLKFSTAITLSGGICVYVCVSLNTFAFIKSECVYYSVYSVSSASVNWTLNSMFVCQTGSRINTRQMPNACKTWLWWVNIYKFLANGW